MIETLAEENSKRLIININDVREFEPSVALTLMKEPSDYIVAFELELSEMVKRLNPDYDGSCSIGFAGTFGKYYVTPRNLLCNMLGRIVSVEGIVTKSSLVLPKVVQTISWNAKTKKFHQKEFRDHMSLVGQPTGYSYPKKDSEGNKLETEFGLCRYKDTQVLYIQEMPERAPAGQLPRSVECLVEDDLVDFVKPGDRIRVIGIYKAVGGISSNGSSGVMRTVIIVNNIQQIGHQSQDPKLSSNDITKIVELSKQENIFEQLSKSMAPSIYGYEVVKKALLLLLFGGVEKKITNTHLRGDINVLLVGDPSTAKSQLLRFMMNLAPLAVSTTGRSSSGVGLTAAIVQDTATGQKTLQAGAMVLADRGVVCVDEFDKMNDVDRTAMHEVMEQQTVTIAKAGVHTTLNARCSVLAAANPLFSSYNPELSVQRNINLPDSLLSRFDLVFVVLDKKDSVRDREIAEHVLNIHMIRENQTGMIEKTLIAQELEETVVEDIFSVFRGQKIFATSFLRKYIYYIKSRAKPVLTQKASEMISEIYCDLRKNSVQKTLPITPRTLETLIRLSAAHAKIRMSKEITEYDVEVIFKILESALYFSANKDVKEDPKKRKRTDGKGERIPKKDKVEVVTEEQAPQYAKNVKDILVRLVKESRTDALKVSDLFKEVQKDYKFSQGEFDNILKVVLKENEKDFMLEDDTIFTI
jgi:DNA replication licensing factor MCM3